jgi:hypothetical protein
MLVAIEELPQKRIAWSHLPPGEGVRVRAERQATPGNGASLPTTPSPLPISQRERGHF